MASELITCISVRCRHQGSPLSLDYFRKSHLPPYCYHYHKRCSDCRKTNPISLPPNLPPPSPSKAKRIQCSKCHHLWSLSRFPIHQGLRKPYCMFCHGHKPSIQVLAEISEKNTISSDTQHSNTSTSMPLSPSPRGRPPPPRTPDSGGLTPSSRRSLARQRTESPPSPTPPGRNLRTSLRIIKPRHFYGDTPTPPPPKLCSRQRHLKPHEEFVDPATGEEYDVCNQCRHEVEEMQLRNLERMRTSIAELQQCDEELQIQLMGQGDLCLRISLIKGNDPLDQSAISDEDRQLIQTFHEKLSKLQMEECNNCHEQWFDMHIDATTGLCSQCRNQNRAKLFNAENFMDPGPSVQELARQYGLKVPEPCTQIEAMCISPVHVMMQAWSVKGGQTKYTGHCCNFIRDTANIVNKIPLLPKDIDIVVVRPKTQDATDQPSLASSDHFRLRREVLTDYIRVLQHSHPSFRSGKVTIDWNALNSLPADGNVYDQLRSITETEEPSGNPGPNDLAPDETVNIDSLISDGFVPHLQSDGTEMTALQNGLQLTEAILTLPQIHGIPINEHDPNLQYMIDAFPILYPTGAADIHQDRPFKVAEHEYFRHLIRFHDSRFATDPRFRYFALNSIMRWDAKKRSRVYSRRNPDDGAMSVGELRDLLAGDAIRLADRVARLAENLRGTRPYWQARRRELLAMLKDLKSPHAFVTASAADVQWKDLHRHMPIQVPLDATEQERIKINNVNLNENPAIAAWYFQRRWELFFKYVLQPKFKITDWWWRFEWQFRGSSHVHAFFWFEDAPPVESLDLNDPESVATFLDYWEPKVSAWNPSKDEPKAAQHPSSWCPLTMTYSLRELAQSINRFQRHTKCTSYCLRRPKGAPEDARPICRFHYPQELIETSSIKLDPNIKYPRLYPKRNDELLNQHNILQLLGWQANVDFTPITSIQAVTTYIAKYCSKTEKKSENYNMIFNSILTSLESDDSATVAFQKLLSKLIVERDWSAQECMHLLLGCELYRSSRYFKSLNVSPQRLNEFEDLNPLMQDDTLASTKLNWIDRYEQRSQELESVSLLQIFRRYQWRNNTFAFMPRTKPRVINVWPQYVPDKSDPAKYDHWCRAKLQLHHPYRNINDLQLVNGENVGWTAAYEHCKTYCAGHDADPLDNEEDSESEIEGDEEFEEPEDDEEEHLIRDWHDLASRGPRTRPMRYGRLGKRDIDVEFNWHHHFTTMDEFRHCEAYLEAQKRQTDLIDSDPVVDIANLVDNQQRIFLRVMDHYERILAGENPPPFRVNIDGTAGTGKSYLIDAITKALNEKARQHGHTSPIIRVAPTGIAAFNIHGATLHQALCLPVRGLSTLTPQQRLILQSRFQPIKYIILDEKSMVGRRLLSRMDSRLREAFPDSQDEYFGGCSLLTFGDFGQLPPVGDIPLYDLQVREGTRDSVLEANKGRDVYLSITENITLNRIMRQRGDDPVAQQFRQVLQHLRDNEITDADVDFLNTRVIRDLPLEERITFSEALHLCPTNAMVDEINLSQLAASDKPVLILPALHKGSGASKGSEDDTEGLQPKLLLMEGAKVMLTRNLWTPQGLTNGTMGIIESMLFAPDHRPHIDLPSVIMVAIPSYQGPTEWYTTEGVPIVPIVPSVARWESKGKKCSRKQFPLRLAYAVSIHKSQGMTLNKAVIELGQADFCRGLSYVAISRVRAISDIAFLSRISPQRLKNIGGSNKVALDLHRRQQLPFIDGPCAEELGFNFNNQ